MSPLRRLALFLPPAVLLVPAGLALVMALEAGTTGFPLQLRLFETAYLYGGLVLVAAGYGRWPEGAAEVLRAAGARPSLLFFELALQLAWTALMTLPPVLAYPELRALPGFPALLAAVLLSGGLMLLAVRVLWWPLGPAAATVLPLSLFIALELLSYRNPALCPLAPALLSKECPPETWPANLLLRSGIWLAAALLAYRLRRHWWPEPGQTHVRLNR